MAISDLPRDLLEEILSRVSVKSIRAVQSTCKYWNTISHDQVFTEKLFGKTLATKETVFLVAMTMDCQIYLMSVNLHDTNVKSCIMRKAKPLRLNNDVHCQLDYRFTVCDGLLLCKTNYLSNIVVWNPYIGETRWIKPRTTTQFKRYVLGYEKKKTNNSIRNHKILGFFIGDQTYNEFELYNLNSDSWKVFYHTCDWELLLSLGMSLKGNTYWLAKGMCIEGIGVPPYYLIFFDFTTERFGPRLLLPFRSFYGDTVTLSSVREEQLAVLFLRWSTQMMEIWVTNKIEPDKVLWNDKLFLTVSIGQYSWFSLDNSSFFIDEKKNVVVVLGSVSCIFGKDGYFKEVDQPREPTETCCYPLMWSYVPSSVQIKKSSTSDAAS